MSIRNKAVMMEAAMQWAEPEIGGEDLESLAALLSRNRGFDLLALKPRLLRRRIVSRLRIRDCPDLPSYLALLAREPDEEGELLRTLTIHVSGFFRNEETFEYLRVRVLPGLVEEKLRSGAELLLVSAGCAEGEEPFSLAMLLHRHFGRELSRLRRRIVGLDVAPEVLTRARAGLYDADRIRELPQAYTRYFRKRGTQAELDLAVRSEVEFLACDLREGLPVGEADLVMCRNVLIYFRRDSQKRILGALQRALRPGGFLALGKTEPLLGDLRSGFRVQDLAEHVYCKAGEEPCGWR